LLPGVSTTSLVIRKWLTILDETCLNEQRLADGEPLLKIAVAAVILNPYAGRNSQSLDEIVDASAELGVEFGRRFVAALAGRAAQSYGKAAIVGTSGEYEHGNAFLTTTFAHQVRLAIGGGKAWVPSTGKRGALGTPIDIPLACKDALYVRSHYDTITVAVPDAPAPDEVVVIMALATRGRLLARLGGLAFDQVQGEDGLS
jgi:hypothetical protein